MGVEPASRRGFLVIWGVLVNPLDNLSTRASRSSNFLTPVSVNEVCGSEFRVRI